MQKLPEELFRLYYRDVYSYLYGMSSDASLSEDLASEVFLEAVRSVSSFRGESGIRTWLFSIARHRWSAYLRKKKRTPQTAVFSAEEAMPEPYYNEPELMEDALAIAENMLAAENETAAEVFRLRLEGFSYAEIAERLGISENSARVVYFRVRNRIRKELEKEGYNGK